MIRRQVWAAAFVGTAVAVVAGPVLSRTPVRTLTPFATSYAYDGVPYDRLFIARKHLQIGRVALRAEQHGRTPSVAGPPYRLTDLSAETGLPGYPLGVNNLGDIAYTYSGDPSYLFGDPEIVHDDGTYTFLGEPPVDPYGDAGAIAYAISNTEDVAGVGITEFDCCTEKLFHADFTPKGGYFGFGFDGSIAYAVNDSNVSVGQAVFSGVPGAAVFSLSPQGGDRHPVLLRPPKNTTWIGTATGINDAGEIVGYAKNRAVVFNLNGYAAVLPVGAQGVSTAAQAINQRGDIVGSAGGQAFLYRNHRVTYLPRPPGETSGNAVALAINASDEVVGEIVDPTTHDSTAFLYVGGQSYDLNTLLPAKSGFNITDAVGINDGGEIVGDAVNNVGNTGISMKPQSSALPTARKSF